MASPSSAERRRNRRNIKFFRNSKRLEQKAREEKRSRKLEIREARRFLPQYMRDYFNRDVAHQISGLEQFGIIWDYELPIRPFAQIFDNLVGHAWVVTVEQDIDGNGNPGWWFQRHDSIPRSR